jgi:hypothetical protein
MLVTTNLETVQCTLPDLAIMQTVEVEAIFSDSHIFDKGQH